MVLVRYYRIYQGSKLIEEGYKNFEWDFVKEMRNICLEETDVQALQDRNISQEWIDYRQFLRDLPQNFTEANDAADAWAEYPIPKW